MHFDPFIHIFSKHFLIHTFKISSATFFFILIILKSIFVNLKYISDRETNIISIFYPYSQRYICCSDEYFVSDT